jgi:hypothetical protein
MSNIQEIKELQELQHKFIEKVLSMLNVDLSDNVYYQDGCLCIYYEDDARVLDIGIGMDKLYSYYFKNLGSDEMLDLVSGDPLDVSKDKMFKEFNSLTRLQ